MTLDTTLNLPTLVTLIIAIVGLIIWLARLGSRVTTAEADISDLTRQFGAVTALVALHKEQFHEYQLQVAKDYVSNTVMADLKRDIITELGRMESRVETQIDRLVEATKQ